MRSRKLFFQTIAGIACVSLLAGGSWLGAQAHRAIIHGQVQDSSGAAVPGADVKVVQKETGVARFTVTNDAGQYEVPGLLPGTYLVEAAQPGFKTGVVDEIPVSSGQRARINITLDLGEITDSITVRSSQQLLDTDSAELATVFDRRKMATLPMGQGNTTYLYQFSPSADSASAGFGFNPEPYQRAGSGLARFSGLPTGTAEFTLDGTPNMQRGNAVRGGAVAFNAPTEVVQEMRIQTTTFDASVGHTGSTTIDTILKSGTNEYHGEAFYFFRNSAWDANSWASNRSGVGKPDRPYKRWGFTAGGPVIKNRTFFFYGFTHWEQSNPQSFPGDVPRPAHLQGDFSDLLALSSQYQLYNPFTARRTADGRVERDPFPNNIIPSDLFHPFSAVLNKYWPTPNVEGTPDGRRNFARKITPLPRQDRHHTIRIDHNLTRSHALFGRILVSDGPMNSYSLWHHHPGGEGEDISPWVALQKVRNYAVSDVWTASPSVVVDFRASVARHSYASDPWRGGLSWQDVPGGIANFVDSETLGFPAITISGYALFSHLPGLWNGFGNSTPLEDISEIRNGAVHLTKMRGSHSFRMGADLRGYIRNLRRGTSAGLAFNGSYTKGPFDNSPAPPIGAGLADFLLGLHASATITRQAQFANLSTYQAFYFQDDWKAAPRLTLNLGVRYEREGPPTERFNAALIGFAPQVDNPIAAEARANYALNPLPELPPDQFQVKGGPLYAGVDGPRQIYSADNNNFSPRFGVAYQLERDTVLRGGYSISFIPNTERYYGGEYPVPGFDRSTFSYASTDAGLTFTTRLGDDLFPNGILEPIGATDSMKGNLGLGLFLPAGLEPSVTNAYAHQFQVAVQRRIGGAHKLEARYVGNRSRDVALTRNMRALPHQYLSTSPERDQAHINHMTELVPNPFRGIAGVGGGIGVSTFTSRANLLTPYAHFSSVTSLSEQLGWTSYNALQIEHRSQFDNGLGFNTSYTWAKTMEGLEFLNAGDPEPAKTISSADRPHVWRFTGSWELPFGRSGAGAARRFAQGWTFSTLMYFQSGVPMPWGNVLFRGDIKDIPVKEQTAERMFNIDAGFERDARNALAYNLRTFPLRFSGVRDAKNADVAVTMVKETPIRERFSVQFRAEAYNLFNWHFFTGGHTSQVNTNPLSSLFGQTSVASPPRQIQMGIKLVF